MSKYVCYLSLYYVTLLCVLLVALHGADNVNRFALGIPKNDL